MNSRRKWVDPEDFHMMRRRAGLAIPAAASLLDVTERTIRNWEQGITKIPYTAYRLLKIVNGYVFACPAWDGWFVRGDTLYSPSQRGFKPHELTYLSNYLWMARQWLSEREQHHNDALVYAARHVDDNPQQTYAGEGKLLLIASQKVIASLLTVLNCSSKSLDRKLADGFTTWNKWESRSDSILVIRTLELNTISMRSTGQHILPTSSNDDCYTLCEVNYQVALELYSFPADYFTLPRKILPWGLA
jgi:transcriptional regulator with XRE-family HTH domain